MQNPQAYESDLAYIHDQGFGGFARGSAPGLLNLLNQAGIKEGRIVDLGCGSGIWARELADAGFQAVGVDISPAMIEIARQRVPGAEFHVESFLQFRIPPCGAVTALGEVFNYLFDSDNVEAAPICRTLQVLILTAILKSKGVFHDQESESQEEPYWTSYLR